MARKKVNPADESLALADVMDVLRGTHPDTYERPVQVHTLRPGALIREGKKKHAVLSIEAPCCRTKVHVRTEGGTACYDVNSEVYV